MQVHISKQATLPSQLSKADTLHSVYQFENWERQLTLKVLVATIDAQWEGVGDVGSARYEPRLNWAGWVV